MKSAFISRLALILSLTAGAAWAANGTWTNNGSGNWSDTTKWLSATMATGQSFTAFFTNPISASRTVTVDAAVSPMTLGHLTFRSATNANTWTVTGGVVSLSVASAAPTVTVMAGSAVISSVVTGTAGLVKSGTGTLTLATAAYGGNTLLDGGTLAYSSDYADMKALVWGPVTGSVTISTLDLNGASVTAAALTNRINNTTTNRLIIGTGRTLTVSGALTIGCDLLGTSTTQTRLVTSGAGTLRVTNSASAITIGQAQASQNSFNSGVVDLASLTSVFFNVSTLRVGYGLTANGVLTLSDSDNVITTAVIVVSDSTNNNAYGTSRLGLGAGESK